MPSRRVFSIAALRNLRESAKVGLGAMLARYAAGICVFTGATSISTFRRWTRWHILAVDSYIADRDCCCQSFAAGGIADRGKACVAAAPRGGCCEIKLATGVPSGC